MSFLKNPYKTLLLMFIQAVAVLLSQEFTVLRAFHPSVHLEWSPSRSTFFSPVLPKLPTVKDVLSFNHHRLIVLSTIKRITGKLNGKNKDIRNTSPAFFIRFNRHKYCVQLLWILWMLTPSFWTSLIWTGGQCSETSVSPWTWLWVELL